MSTAATWHDLSLRWRMYESIWSSQEGINFYYYLHYTWLIQTFLVEWDLTDFLIWVVLGQRHTKVFLIIYYASKTLIDVQVNYTTTGNKLLVVVFAFDKVISYLLGTNMVAYTNPYASFFWKSETRNMLRINWKIIFHIS